MEYVALLPIMLVLVRQFDLVWLVSLEFISSNAHFRLSYEKINYCKFETVL